MADTTKEIINRLIRALASPKEAEKVMPILITSPDRVRRERAAHYLACGEPLASSASRRDTSNKVELIRRHGKDLSLEKLHSFLDEASSMSIFSTCRAFLLLDFHECAAETQKLYLSRVQRLNNNSRLIVTSEPLTQNNPLRKLCDKQHSHVQFEELKKFDFSRWLERELTRAGITQYTPDALELLIALSEDSPDQAAAMVEQLSLYLENGSLTKEDILSLFVSFITSNDFEFAELIASSQANKVRKRAAELLREGRNPFLLLGLLNKNFSNYFTIEAGRESGLTSAQIRTKLSSPPWLFSRQERLSKLRNRAEYTDSFRALIRSDSRLKNRSLGAAEVFFELCDELSSTR